MALKQCSMCDRTFTKLEHVKRHERSHTRERPYECPTCKKHFSRSDVLFRHCKGHSQNALNRMKSDEHSHHEYRDFDDNIRPLVSHIETGLSPAGTPQIRREPSYSPASRRIQSQVSLMNGDCQFSHLSSPSHPRSSTRMHPASPGEHRLEALINAAHHLEPTAGTPWRSPSPMGFSRSEHAYTVGRSQDSMGPPIDPAIGVLSFAPTPAEHVSSLDQWAFELVQNHNPVPNRTPADALQTWLFPLESELHDTTVDGFFDQDTFRNASENQVSPTGSSVSIASRVPRERFQRVQNCWPCKERTSSRLMPDLWQDITSSDCANILSERPQDYTETPLSERERRTSRWGLDEECRSMLQNTLSQNPATSESYCDTVSSSGEVASSPLPADSHFPPAEILDIALEMYLYYFHPTLPIIHIPTFSAKHAPQTLLLCMCLIGMSILGTAGATKYVTKIFPAVLQLVITEFQSLSSTNHSPCRQMRIIATSLLALNLASITGKKSRIAQVETLYVELVTLAQNQGLFCANEGAKIDLLLDEVVDIEAKWKAWAKVESGKRIIFGLIEADCWWAGYLSTIPLIRPDAVQILPPSESSLFHINSAMKWFQLVQRGARHHPRRVTPLQHLTPGLQVDASSFRSLLTLTLLRIYESNDRLAPATGSQKQLEPWRIYAEDQRSHDILPLLINLSSSSIDALRTADLNSAVLWHGSCMLLSANIRYFELAAGRSGPEPAVNALEDISMWSQTPSARRSVLHAAQIYKLLFDRKVSDIVNPLSVVALFHAALVLGLYIFTLPPTITCDMNDTGIELLDMINWVSIGHLGFSDTLPSTSPHTFNLSDTYSSIARNFIRHGGPFSITGIPLEGGYLAARRTLLHCADLMEGIGRWKSRTFSQILHIMSDDLTDYDGPDEEEA